MDQSKPPRRHPNPSSRIWIALVGLALIGGLACLTAARSIGQLEGRTRSETLAFPNLDFEAAIGFGLVVVLAIVLYLLFGRSHQKSVHPAWNIQDLEAMHPAVFGRLCRWNRANSGDLAASIIKLAVEGSVEVIKTSRTNASGNAQLDYLLRRGSNSPSDFESIEGALDRATMHFVFNAIGEGKDEVSCLDIHSFGRHRADDFSAAMKAWQISLNAEAKRARFLDPASVLLHYALYLGTAAVALTGFYLLLATGSFVPLALSAISAAVVAVVAYQMPRLTQTGAQAYQNARAFNGWLAEGKDTGDCGSAELEALLPHAFVLRKHANLAPLIKGDEGEQRELVSFLNELGVCIMGTSFAAESVISQQSVAAFARPVSAALSGQSVPTGFGNPHQDTEDLFVKHPRR